MKILVISDIHLSARFDEKRFTYLQRIIEPVDKVVLNGDFWDGFTTTFDQFINSPWQKLFPILKKKHTVYIFGNHDKEKFMDARMELFSDTQTYRYELTSGKTHFIFEHGNRHAPLLDEWMKWDRPPAIIQYAFGIMQHTFVNTFNRKLLKLMFYRYNKKIKKQLPKELKHNHMYVCGHTHCAEIDLENKFVNSGLNQHGLGQYVLIEDGKIELREERYS